MQNKCSLNLKRNLCGCCPKRINRRDVEQMQPKFEKKSVWMLSEKNQQRDVEQMQPKFEKKSVWMLESIGEMNKCLNLKRNLCGCCPKRINRRDVEQMQPKFEKKSVWMLSKKNQQERCRTNAA